MSIEICNYCKGKGCGRCHKTGEVVVEKCYMCLGKGRIPHEPKKKCPFCKGTGYKEFSE
jgi:DnaJ-class molecular chaperone